MKFIKTNAHLYKMTEQINLQEKELSKMINDAVGHISNFFAIDSYSGLEEESNGLTIRIGDRPTFGFYEKGRGVITLPKKIKHSHIGHEVGHFIHHFINPRDYNSSRDLAYRYGNQLASCYLETVADYSEFVYVCQNKVKIRFGKITTDVKELQENLIYVSEILPRRDIKTLQEKNVNLCLLHFILRKYIDSFEKNEQIIGIVEND